MSEVSSRVVSLFYELQAIADGIGQTHLDLTISVPANMTVRDSHAVESRVRDAIISARREVREVKIHVHGQGQGQGDEEVKEGVSGKVTSDFGKEGC
jgi:divalent metal cation (Fe/Co/Zn/Cd) transporter